MGGRFKRDGIYVYLWLIHVEVWQKTTKFCKAIFFQWIMNTFFKVDFPQQRALTLMGEGLSQEWKRNNISLLSTLPGVFIAENCTVVIWNRVVEVYVKKNLRIQRKTLSLTYMESTPKHTHTTPRQPLQQAPSSLTADYSFSYDEGFFSPHISRQVYPRDWNIFGPFNPTTYEGLVRCWNTKNQQAHEQTVFFRHRMLEWIS